VTTPAPEPTYALVELMGHVTIIGAVSDTTIAGAPALRIDRLDGRSQHVWPQSLYRVTELSEEEARALWDRQSRSRVTGLPPSLAYHLTLATAALEAGSRACSCAGHDHETDEDGVCRHCGCETPPAEDDDDDDPWHSDGGDQYDDEPDGAGLTEASRGE
jgi:hypothetical protein